MILAQRHLTIVLRYISAICLGLFCVSASTHSYAAESGQTDSKKTIIVEWNQQLLEAVRHAAIGPPMVARALAVAHTCMYDAWAAYDERAMGTLSGDRLRRPAAERTMANKTIAISYAAYRAALDLFPAAKPALDDFMKSRGYDPANPAISIKAAAEVGNAACAAVLTFRQNDGSNESGEMAKNRKPYADYTGYVAINEAGPTPGDFLKVQDPDRFQPLYYAPNVRPLYPPFVGAQWFKVLPFAGPYEGEISRVLSEVPLARSGFKEYQTQAEELLEISAGLTDEKKMIVEYWADGPNSELPPGHWCLFAQFVSMRDNHTLDEDTKMFFVLTNALMDAGIAAWQEKRSADSVRPITAVHYLFHGKTIQAWGGPGKGTISMDGSVWLPYQPAYLPTPPFPEYPSGHSTFSAAAARILQLWTGSDKFDDQFIFEPGSSRVEPGITPKTPITLRWPTFSFAANQAGMSRRYGGIHFKSGDLAGRMLGCLVAEKVWLRGQNYFGAPAKPQRAKAVAACGGGVATEPTSTSLLR